jgi:hypothetical protein
VAFSGHSRDIDLKPSSFLSGPGTFLNVQFLRRDGNHNSVIFVNSYLVSRSCIDRMKFIIDYHEDHHGCFHNCGSVVISGD